MNKRSASASRGREAEPGAEAEAGTTGQGQKQRHREGEGEGEGRADHLLEEGLIPGIQRTSHHGLLPHQHPPLITHVIEVLRGVQPPTPYPDHVHVSCHC